MQRNSASRRPANPGQGRTAQECQQQVEGGIKTHLQFLKRAWAYLTNWPARQGPLTADSSSKGIDEQLSADHYRQGLKDKALTIKGGLRSSGRPTVRCS